MGLSRDNQECVQVSLRLEDWATLIAALSFSHAPLADKERINSTIFNCAHETERTLS